MRRTILFAIILVNVFSPPSLQSQTPLTIAPHFEAKDFNGNPHLLYEYLDAGKHVLLSFYTLNCGSCIIYSPHLSQIYDHYGCNTGDLIVLGINWGATNSQLASHHQIYGLQFPALSGQEGYGNSITSLFEISSFITVILISPNRDIVMQYLFPPTFSALDSVMQLHGIVASPCVTGSTQSIISENVDIDVFPNPAHDILFMRTNITSSGLHQVFLANLNGSIVRDVRMQIAGKGSLLRICIQGLPPGLYNLTITNELGLSVSRRVIIC